MFTARDLGTIQQFVHKLTREPFGELEFRFSTQPHPGLFNVPVHPNQIPKNYRFQPGVSKEAFYRTLNHFDGYRLPKTTIETTDENCSNGVRYSHNHVDGTSTFIKKTRKSFFDFWNLDIRVCLSSEDPVPAATMTTQSTTRHKRRVSFHDQSVRYDFTVVTFATKSFYEIEIEVIREAITGSANVPANVHNVVQKIALCTTQLLKVLQGGQRPMTLTEHRDVSVEYNLMTSNKEQQNREQQNRATEQQNREQKSSQQDLSFVRFIGAQPETIHKRHVQQVLSGSHAISHKLDGERFLLFVSQNGHIYLLGRNTRFIASGITTTREKGLLLDVEMCDGVIHAFDLLYRNGVRSLEHLQGRLKHLQEAVKSLSQSNRGFSHMIKPKEHFFSNIPQYFAEWDVVDATIPCRDGFIFTPIHEQYPTSTKWPNLLKWKPHGINSIDFKIKVERDGRWTFLVGDSDGQCIPFAPHPTTQYAPHFGAVCMHNNIVECRWNGEMFVPTRWRQDRVVPNYKTVALDVWESIQYPVHASDFYETQQEQWHRDLILRTLQIRKTSLPKLNWADDEGATWSITVLDLGAGSTKVDWTSEEQQCTNIDTGVETYDTKHETKHHETKHHEGKHHERKHHERKSIRNKRDLVPDAFDVVDCRFVLQRFYASQKTFDELLRILTKYLRQGGYLVASCLDAETVYRFCTHDKDTAIYRARFDTRFPLAHLRQQEFQLEFDEKAPSTAMNTKDTVANTTANTTVKSVGPIEYLVFADLFVNRMINAGFVCLETNLVQDQSTFNGHAKTHRTFIFRKEYVPPAGCITHEHPDYGTMYLKPLESDSLAACLGPEAGQELVTGQFQAFVDRTGTYLQVLDLPVQDLKDKNLTEYTPVNTLDDTVTLIFVNEERQKYRIAYHRCPETREMTIRFPRLAPPKLSEPPSQTPSEYSSKDVDPSPRRSNSPREIPPNDNTSIANALEEKPLTGRNCWTIDLLKGFARSHNITLPSQQRRKHEIYEYIKQHLA